MGHSNSLRAQIMEFVKAKEVQGTSAIAMTNQTA